MKRTRFVVLVGAGALALAGCSSTPTLDLDAGWEWMLTHNTARDEGLVFDDFTGEVRGAVDDSGTGLTMSGATPDPQEWDVALAESERWACESYAAPSETLDPLAMQGVDISLLLHYTFRAAIADRYPDGYSAANNEVVAWVDQNAKSIHDVETGSEEWTQLIETRDTLFAERMHSDFPQFADAYDDTTALARELYDSLYADGMVRAAQDTYIERCDLAVAADYEYPTPEELGIDVSGAK